MVNGVALIEDVLEPERGSTVLLRRGGELVVGGPSAEVLLDDLRRVQHVLSSVLWWPGQQMPLYGPQEPWLALGGIEVIPEAAAHLEARAGHQQPQPLIRKFRMLSAQVTAMPIASW